MKKLLFITLVTLSFTACQKKEVEPANPAEAVAGTYALKSFYFVQGNTKIDAPSVPATDANGRTLTGDVVLTPQSTDDLVTFKLTLRLTGIDDQAINIDRITVRESGGKHSLFLNNQQVAEINGKTMNFNVKETDATTKETLEMRFTAER